jgi:hypothetical protein
MFQHHNRLAVRKGLFFVRTSDYKGGCVSEIQTQIKQDRLPVELAEAIVGLFIAKGVRRDQAITALETTRPMLDTVYLPLMTSQGFEDPSK